MSKGLLIKAIRYKAALANLQFLKNTGLQKLANVNDIEQSDIEFFEALIDLQTLKLTAENETDAAMYEEQINQLIKDN